MLINIVIEEIQHTNQAMNIIYNFPIIASLIIGDKGLEEENIK